MKVPPIRVNRRLDDYPYRGSLTMQPQGGRLVPTLPNPNELLPGRAPTWLVLAQLVPPFALFGWLVLYALGLWHP